MGCGAVGEGYAFGVGCEAVGEGEFELHGGDVGGIVEVHRD